MMADQRIGITGEHEPMVCACLQCAQAPEGPQLVRGRHANTYSIEGTLAYYRILAKHVEVWDSNPDNHAGIVKEYKASKKPALIIEDKKEVK